MSTDNICCLAPVTLSNTWGLMQYYLGMDMCLCHVVGLSQTKKKCRLYRCQCPCSIIKTMVRRARFLSTIENYICKPNPTKDSDWICS